MARLKNDIRPNISSVTFYLRENASKGNYRSSKNNKKYLRTLWAWFFGL